MEKREYTKEQVQELIKCRDNPVYFIENYMKLWHPVRGCIPFQMYDCQKRMVMSMHDHKAHITMAGRQSGISSTHVGYVLWWTLFKRDQYIALGSRTENDAKDMLERLWVAFMELPDWMKPDVVVDNVKSKQFSNGNRLEVFAVKPWSLKGRCISLLYVDNVAYIPESKFETFFKYVAPVFGVGTTVLLSSTANKDNDLFMRMWKAATPSTESSIWSGDWSVPDEGFAELVSKNFDFYSFYSDWTEVPESVKSLGEYEYRGDAFKGRMLQDMSPMEFQRQFECVPNGSVS